MDERDRRADRGPGGIVEGFAGASTPGDDDREVAALLGVAGPRQEISWEDLDAVTAAARVAWRRKVDEVAAGRRARRTKFVTVMTRVAAGLAAVLVVAVAVLWWSGRRSGDATAVVAEVEAVTGSVRMTAARGGPEQVVEGLTLGPEAELETGGAAQAVGRLSLRLAGGVTVRADAGTILRVASAEVLELRRGAVYVDTGTDGTPAAPRSGRSPGIEVRTPVGNARDVGTRFAVRLLGAGEPTLRVRVRDGAVLVEQRGASFRAGAGDELVLRGDGTVERRRASVWGDDWSWVLDAAPGFDLEGRTLAEFLDWVSRETGWDVQFEDERLAASAGEITLHGSLGGLRADQAPLAVLPGAGLEGTLQDGTLTVRRSPVTTPR